MKLVECSYRKCGKRRRHWQEPDTPRGHQLIKVGDDQEDAMFCSITCACMAGAMSVRSDAPKCKKCGWLLDYVGDNDHEPENSGAICRNPRCT